MFKHTILRSNKHALSNKDKKKIKELQLSLWKDFEEIVAVENYESTPYKGLLYYNADDAIALVHSEQLYPTCNHNSSVL
jgi:hypothetical protein